MKRALITGITGQDGSYLAELLLSKGYEVHGIIRRSSSFNHGRIQHIYDYIHPKRLILHYGDLTDMASLVSVIRVAKPDEIYNLAAQSHVKVSFEVPLYTGHVDALGTLNIIEAVRTLGLNAKIYQASTSEMYSGAPNGQQNEDTPFHPQSPYGVAKLYAFHISRIYRESYGMFVVNGILFNHESERRGESFVTRKVTLGIKEIIEGKRDVIQLGNLDAKRDWGHAKDYVEAMYLMLQQKTPKDYVIATGIQHTVREFCTLAFKEAGIKLIWQGKGLKERGVDARTGKTRISVDPKFFRPNEVWSLRGNAAKARRELGWKPKISFKELVKRMVHSDVIHNK
ncbi:MAG TPA: GDP-mannose 4,6-dehydratase [Candidatus Paceibacterota bacterium]